MLKTTASNSPDDDVVIMFSRALGSSRGLNYFSIGISFMLLGGTSATRQITFLIEPVLEGPCALFYGAIEQSTERILAK
jgi:hypothetical protein